MTPIGSAGLMERGGDIALNAGGSIISVPDTQLINAWLWRAGTVQGSDFPSPTMWGVEFNRFRQGVGALAGGDVSLRAGADIDNVSAVIPSIGVPTGATEFDNVPEVRGGGSLWVEAGGDIGGGIYYVGKGRGELRAGGSIRAGTGWNHVGRPLHTTLALGDGEFILVARQDLALETVFNPTLLMPSPEQESAVSFSDWITDFSTYAPNSAVSVSAIAGDAELHGDVEGLRVTTNTAPCCGRFNQIEQDLTVYPPILRVSALSGDITTGSTSPWDTWIRMIPSVQGRAELLAHGDVSFFGNGLLISGGDPALLPTPTSPQAGAASGDRTTFSWQRLFDVFGPYVRADTPCIHGPMPKAAGYEGARAGADRGAHRRYRYVGLGGIERAGGDELHADESDRGGRHRRSCTHDHASRGDGCFGDFGRGDISYTVMRNTSRAIIPQFAEIAVDGPGELILLTGGNLDLKASPGIMTRGNTVGTTLADSGANITVMTGIAQAPGYDAFIARYLAEGETYAEALAAYLVTQGVDAAGAPLDAFRALARERQIPFLTQVLFSELRASGRKAATEGSSDFEAGYAALETLFPGIDPENDPRGDVSLFFSRIYTLDGGDIDILAPGGVVNVGLATPPSSFGVAKTPSQLGIVAQRNGSVNILSGADTLVNQSRVFAADGGSILMWSSAGDIDAGRGAKSAISAPAALIIYDANGLPTVEFPPALTGSVRAFVTTAGREPGDVDLYAPVGVINAGDAGIGSAGNVTVAATEVIGADNIDIGGVAVGVPVADTGGLAAGLTGVSNVSSAAAKSSEDSLGGAANQASDSPLADAAFAVLDVVVLGLGEGEKDESAPRECGEDRDEDCRDGSS